MELIADILLVAGALGAGFYCFVLARRLRRFNDLENGVGGAVAVLSAQVDDLRQTLEAAQRSSDVSNSSLHALTERAEAVSKRLELTLAALDDLPHAAPALGTAASQGAEAPHRAVDTRFAPRTTRENERRELPDPHTSAVAQAPSKSLVSNESADNIGMPRPAVTFDWNVDKQDQTEADTPASFARREVPVSMTGHFETAPVAGHGQLAREALNEDSPRGRAPIPPPTPTQEPGREPNPDPAPATAPVFSRRARGGAER